MRLMMTALAVCVGVTAASATEYSCPQIRLVVPFASASPGDIAARMVAERLNVRMKRNVVIENHGGATGNIGTKLVVDAAPDGCTLLLNVTAIATFPMSFVNLRYNPFEDLTPVGGIGRAPTLLLAPPSLLADDIKSLVALSKQRFDGLTYSVADYGLQPHLAVEQLKHRTGAHFVIVPYKGSGAALADLVAARVDFGSFPVGTAGKALIEERRLKALAVVQDRRTSVMPDVPSTAEQGFPGLFGGTQYAVFAPAATPKEIVGLLGDDLREVIGEPIVRQRFLTIGFEPTQMSSEEVAAAMEKIAGAMAAPIKRLNIRHD